MAVKISKKIKSYSVVRPEDKLSAAPAAAPVVSVLPMAEVIQMHERLERPECLEGSTYKIKSPLFEHALYVTINDIVLNENTPHEQRRPFEVFINSKNMEHFQWAVALTRIMSAVFRKGGDVTFLVEELKAVFDPRGGYYKAGGVYMPSVVAELGIVIEDHLKRIGLIKTELSPEMRELIAKKRAEVEARDAKLANSLASNAASVDSSASASFPASATQCHKCATKALVLMDGCSTCLNCGYSKCG
jgi:hypothetical protein